MKCSECNWCWQSEEDDFPRGHFEGWGAPCEGFEEEEDEYDD